ncbi:MAG: glycosyltransferase, partial [Bacteroidales bacterium]|nr:glycosyltransferase [Bacteroidales bacterium]
MKIIIAGTAFPYRGGLAAYNERLARQFNEEGHDVEIITFTLQYPSFLFPGKTQFLEGSPPGNLNISRKINSVNPLNWVKTGLHIRRAKPDILIFKYWLPFMAPCFGTIARIASRNSHTKVICIFDNVIPHEKRPGDTLLTRYFLKPLDAAVAMSAKVLQDFARFRPSIPVKLSPHPLFDNFGDDPGKSMAASSLGIDINDKYILFFGFVRSYKGLDLLLEAFAISATAMAGNVKLIVAGEFYESEEPYMKIIRERNISDKVLLFNRFINDDEVATFFGVSDLVVQPYKRATQSGVTQIAYHFNKPMVVTGVGGLKEIVPDGKCGFVVAPQPSEIAAAIDMFYGDGNFAAIFAEGISEEKKRYGWDRMTGTILE